MKQKILIVDDEPDALELVRVNLANAGFFVATAEDGDEALKKARALSPDLILLDVMLPQADGLEVCKILRRDDATRDIPIIMLTARAAEIDRVLGLELGADDYVTKPFSPRELVLRVKALLRRGKGGDDSSEQIRIGSMLIDIARHTVHVQNRPIDLTATEFKLLTMLAQRRGRVLTRELLLRDVWEYDTIIDSRTVDTHMRRLREKLGPASKHLDTVRGGPAPPNAAPRWRTISRPRSTHGQTPTASNRFTSIWSKTPSITVATRAG